MTGGRSGSLQWSRIAVGDELPQFDLDVTSTRIVAGAIASRDFMPAHHDSGFAIGQGAPDIFMNILTTNGYVSRFVSDWAGPEAMLRNIKIRLGAPAVPGKILRFTAHVTGTSREGDEGIVELEIRAANDLGDHATGSVRLSLPLVENAPSSGQAKAEA
ncbi:MAG: acyl dehydratase [Myxococcales bacterium]|nr:acyl dehydratase [Myxococcales bacterium]